MGKVQEALAKIHRKVNPTAKLADKLRIPAQHKHQNSTLPTQASAVKKWIIAQGAASSSVSRTSNPAGAKALLRALQHSNRSICKPTVRFQIMEEYEVPFSRAMQALDMRYLYLDFPMQPEAEKTFLLAATLCQEMAYGYKIIIADSLRCRSGNDESKIKIIESVLNKNTDRNIRYQSLKSAFRHLNQLALRYSQINRDWPADIWPDLNSLAEVAIYDKTINKIDPLANEIDQAQTIQQQYASLCALHILDQKQMTPEDVRSLFIKLIRYSNLITIHNSQQLSSHSATQYSIDEDGPPALTEFRLQKADTSLMHLDLRALLVKLNSEEDAQTTTEPHVRMTRKHSRTTRATEISATSGLSEIYKRIKLTPPEEYIKSQFTNLRQLIQEKEQSSLAEQHQINLLNQTNLPQGKTFFEVENESNGGFCLSWTGKGSCKIQIGELLAHCYFHIDYKSTILESAGHEHISPLNQRHRNLDDEISWHLSVVRWLRTEADGTLRLGVESLSQHTKAVEVVRGINPQQNSKTTIDALMINYQPIDSKARMLILPRQNYKTGEIIAYKDGRRFRKVKLIEKVELCGDYQCFATKAVQEQVIKQFSTEHDHYQMAV